MKGIAASILDGLSYGNGDAVIGVNPATDNLGGVEALLHMLDRIRERYAIPTQICVLAHVTTQMQALRRGAPVDLVFQSIAGTEAANTSFGVNLAMLDEALQAARELAAGRECHVLRDRAGQRAFGRTRTTAWTSRPAKRARTRSRGGIGRCW